MHVDNNNIQQVLPQGTAGGCPLGSSLPCFAVLLRGVWLLRGGSDYSARVSIFCWDAGLVGNLVVVLTWTLHGCCTF